jgi:hypothetical protein
VTTMMLVTVPAVLSAAAFKVRSRAARGGGRS